MYKNLFLLLLVVTTPIAYGMDELTETQKKYQLSHQLAFTRNTQEARELIERGADVNELIYITERVRPTVKLGDKLTPLHIAVIDDDIERATLLLNQGANPNIGNVDWDETPLFYARSLNMAQLLLENGADPNWQSDLNTVLSHFTNRADKEMLRLLQKFGTTRKRPSEFDIVSYYKKWQSFMHKEIDPEVIELLTSLEEKSSPSSSQE